MEALLKIHNKKPIEVPLPGNQNLDVFVQGYEPDLTGELCPTIKCFYYSSEKLNYLTSRIIKGYIHKHLRTHLKLFSIDEPIFSNIEVR